MKTENDINTQAADSDWLPIESAPKDGTIILVPMRDRVVMAAWDAQKYHRTPKPYWASSGPFGVTSDRANQPSVYQPLPAMPK